ncbi:UbiH/UbiF/VisC/COQ6 family ubiquinone biosynthesis hydroxylase [Lichenicoccus sp.]|uniref:UbiH/UbiF/VisC/COQ6 family ubiquinone biosynthesis hydroxylase n=1 Tax=Lichenicoccus sp. TaxID=2781899 RepID=UPI003D146311
MAPEHHLAVPSGEPPRGRPDHDVDVCVVGAGPVGATLACRLAAGGVSVAVVDRAALPPMEHPDFDGRAYAIAAGSRRLLEAAGVWQRLPRRSCPIEGIRVSDGRPGQAASPLFLHFEQPAPGEPFGWMTEARHLRMALNDALHASPLIRLHAPDQAHVARDADGVRIVTGSGQDVRARLVVAAEGRESPLRAEAGIAVTRFPYRQTGIVTAIAHERPHNNLALEHFLPGGPFAQLPMQGGEAGADFPAANLSAANLSAANLSAIVWTEREPLATRLAALDEAGFTRELQRRLGWHLGPVRPVGRRWTYRLGALHAHRYVAERLALVGDAAHGIHPIAGQGLNLGFRDVAALAALVVEAVALGEDPGAPDLLARYQAARRPANLAMLAATDVLDRLFSSDNPALRLARGLGIGAVHRMPRLKRAFVTQAMG